MPFLKVCFHKFCLLFFFYLEGNATYSLKTCLIPCHRGNTSNSHYFKADIVHQILYVHYFVKSNLSFLLSITKYYLYFSYDSYYTLLNMTFIFSAKSKILEVNILTCSLPRANHYAPKVIN